MVLQAEPEVRHAINSTAFTVERFFTRSGDDPYDAVEWEFRTAVIADETGNAFFEQKDAEMPKAWSQTATNVVVSKYFRGQVGTEKRERSVRQLIGRVASTITDWGLKDAYFADVQEAQTFHDELTHLLLNQKMAFNSPVWFNVGVEEKPQCSACFILSVDDTMESILDWCKTEGMIFKGGSGSGVNLSAIRSSQELLAAGGQDGRLERGPPGYRGLHRSQGERGAEGVRSGRGRLGHVAQRRRLVVDPVPERQQLGPGDG